MGKLKVSRQVPMAGEDQRRAAVRLGLRRFWWGVLGGSGHALGSAAIVWLGWWVRSR
ncbi:hypothetical protein [Kitasatospora sp. NPDC089509]|uniref:hypothetical protein n=1 Tax=Kitasatospora sp. NPDC089509 TaxID=3364079 RepID=UPI003829F035